MEASEKERLTAFNQNVKHRSQIQKLNNEILNLKTELENFKKFGNKSEINENSEGHFDKFYNLVKIEKNKQIWENNSSHMISNLVSQGKESQSLENDEDNKGLGKGMSEAELGTLSDPLGAILCVKDNENFLMVKRSLGFLKLIHRTDEKLGFFRSE